MNLNFNDKHIIVTGGAGTLGTATVKLFLDAGATVSVPCFDQQEFDSFELKGKQNVFAQPDINLAREEDTQSYFGSAVEKQGPLWASVHIAGGFGMGSIEETPLEDFNKQLQMNTITCYNSCRAAVQWMRESPFEGGRIVNIASRPGLEPRQGKDMSAYTVAKAGVAALTESLAAELVEEKILVNAIAPSIIDTPANRNAMPDADYDKWPKPEQLARQIAFLCSEENEVTRGGVIPVYGRS